MLAARGRKEVGAKLDTDFGRAGTARRGVAAAAVWTHLAVVRVAADASRIVVRTAAGGERPADDLAVIADRVPPVRSLSAALHVFAKQVKPAPYLLSPDRNNAGISPAQEWRTVRRSPASGLDPRPARAPDCRRFERAGELSPGRIRGVQGCLRGSARGAIGVKSGCGVAGTPGSLSAWRIPPKMLRAR